MVGGWMSDMSFRRVSPIPVEEMVSEPTLMDVINGLATFDLKLSDMTCTECSLWRQCDLAFDPYNTAGDCLLSK